MKKKTFGEWLRDTFFYCGVTKEEYDSIKPEAYKSNFAMWRLLHACMTVIVAVLFLWAMISGEPSASLYTYSLLLIYATAVTILFTMVLEPDSLFAQLLIYATMALLLLAGLRLSLNQPDMMAVTFIVMLVMLPMFVIDKPYYMALMLIVSACVYYVCIRRVKTDVALIADGVNLWVYTPMAILINVTYNSFRVRDLLMQKTIEQQRDTDDLTGLLNKSALKKTIGEQILSGHRGIMLSVDLDDFKRINDTYGHDLGDIVLSNLANCMRATFEESALMGRFGGDEFIIYLKDTDDVDLAVRKAAELIENTRQAVHTPDPEERVQISIGIALQDADERDYESLFKKSDIALYAAKNMEKNTYVVYHEQISRH